jgi:hypothetical protein
VQLSCSFFIQSAFFKYDHFLRPQERLTVWHILYIWPAQGQSRPHCQRSI